MRAGLLQSKRSPVADPEEAVEFYFQQGWTDGLPIVPPTPARVERMLTGTRRDPAELMGLMSSNQGRATVEKLPIHAVMGGGPPQMVDGGGATEPPRASPTSKARLGVVAHSPPPERAQEHPPPRPQPDGIIRRPSPILERDVATRRHRCQVRHRPP